ncbi:GGDEF domain-containing protein [Aestuariispira ectoiniformans]|uniref:GGDEF domain-containing protein n=1 Tax=Aestuariispira ectoiniformans TaxID=2775080 RepID=UPI00223C11F1|nr:GGDEF domain-containing protein [Aestuariispira ectoiniformans]
MQSNMMVNKSREQSVKAAETALANMAEYGLDPSPRNYAVWYAFAMGEPAELAKVLQNRMDHGRDLSQSFCDQLYNRYFSTKETEDAIHSASERIQAEMEKLLTWLSEASGGAEDFSDSVKSGLELLFEGDGLENLRTVMERMVTETKKVRSSNARLHKRLQESSSEISELRENLASLKKEALTDPLTGLYNRKQFDLSLRDAAVEMLEEEAPLCLALLDIDNFKKFNDTYGHQVGDSVLRLVANTLSKNTKGQDTAVRYGGEEFALILPRTRLEDAERVCEQIREAVAGKVLRNRQSGEALGRLTISVGVSAYEQGESLEQFFKRTDDFLYSAKKAGRNRTVAG